MWKAIVSVFLLSCSLAITSGYLIKGEDVLLYFSSVNVTVRKPGLENPPSISFNTDTSNVSYVIEGNGTSRIVKLNFLSSPSPVVESLTIDLTVTPGSYWKVSEINAAVKGVVDSTNYNPGAASAPFRSSFPIEAPGNKSFHCGNFGDIYPAFGQGPTFGNITPIIQIFGLQMQLGQNNGTFKDAWECVGFFSAGIWSGIFVVALLIGIMTWGLAMIMSVKTMDRFDDPKGKPISFAGTE
jgi:hypothetical protein